MLTLTRVGPAQLIGEGQPSFYKSVRSLRKSIITISEKCSGYDFLKIFIYQIR